MNKLIACTIILAAGCVFFGCGEPKEENINLTKSFSGPYFSIEYPEGYDVETRGNDLLIKGDLKLEVRSQAYQGVKPEDMTSLKPVIDQVESRANQLGAEFLTSEIQLGDYKAILAEMYTVDSVGLVAFIPLPEHLITVGAEDPFKVDNPKNSSKTKLLRAMIESFRLTRVDYFNMTQEKENNTAMIQKGTTTYKGELLEVSLPSGWEAQEQGIDGLMLLPSDPLRTDETVSISILRSTGKTSLQYTQSMMKVFSVSDYEQITLSGTGYYMIKGNLAGVPIINLITQKGSTIFMIQSSQINLDGDIQKVIEGIKYK